MIKLPELTQAPLRHRGRNVRAGYQQGWGLQYADLAEQVRKDKLFREALESGCKRSVVSEHNRINIFLLLQFEISPRLAARINGSRAVLIVLKSVPGPLRSLAKRSAVCH